MHEPSETDNRMIDLIAEKLLQLRLEYQDQGIDGGDGIPTYFGSFYSSNDSLSNTDVNGQFSGNQFFPANFNAAAEFNYGTRSTDTPNTWPIIGNAGDESDPFCFVSNCPSTPPYYSGNRHASGGTNRKSLPFPMTKRDHQEWMIALRPPTPGFGYACRICGQRDHYVQHCPRAPPREEVKTPYQGHNQCYGLFKCDRCKREWGYHKSHAETGEFCRTCGHFVYPYKQYPLDKIPPSKMMKMKRGKTRN